MIQKSHSWTHTWKVKCYSLSHVQIFATPWTIAHQAPLSMEFSRRTLEWEPFPSPGDLPDPGTEPRSPALRADSLLSESPGKLIKKWNNSIFSNMDGYRDDHTKWSKDRKRKINSIRYHLNVESEKLIPMNQSTTQKKDTQT